MADRKSLYQRRPQTRAQKQSSLRPDTLKISARPPPRRKSGWRTFCRVLFGIGLFAYGMIMLLPALEERITLETALSIGVSLLVLYLSWLVLADRHHKILRLPF